MTRGRRLAFTLAALVAGLVSSWIILRFHQVRATAIVEAVLNLLVGWSFVGTGLHLWSGPRRTRVGPLMVGAGFAYFVSSMALGAPLLMFVVGPALGGLSLALVAHLVLAFPTGRIKGTLPLAVVVAAYVDALVPQLLVLAVAERGCGGCPPNPFVLYPSERLTGLIVTTQSWGAIVLGAAAIVLLLRRWLRARPAARRSAAPVLLTGSAAFAHFVLMLAIGLHAPGSRAELITYWLFLLALGCVPLSFWLGLLRTRLGHASVADLVRQLRQGAPGGELRDVLAASLADPTLEVAYWVPEQQRYVDAQGHPTTLPAPGEGRAATLVEHHGRLVAALLHDPSLREDPALVDAVGAAAALALDNQRLQAELRARVGELAASRARLVEAADSERRRIERNLHDGTQQRLVSVSMALGLAQAKLPGDPAAAGDVLAEARAGLGAALQELRSLSQGIHPAILTERGLCAALRELVLGAALPVTLHCDLQARLPEPVEAAAYYVAAEALANVAKHAGAAGVVVDVRLRDHAAVVAVTDDGKGGADPARGSGLRGLADRVAALGGRLSVDSPPGHGTALRAELPCASS